MSSPAAICGTFADYRLVRTRSVLQLVIEVPVEQQGAAFAALGYPLPGTEIPVAVARLNSSAGSQSRQDLSDNERTDVLRSTGGISTPQTKPLAGDTTRERRQWESLTPQQQAGILCADKGFQKFLRQEAPWVQSEQDAAEWVRSRLGVDSRRELKPGDARIDTLNDIRAEFLEWAGRVPVAAR